MRWSFVASIVCLMALGCAAPASPVTPFTPATPGVLRVATNLPAPGFWNGSSVAELDDGFEYSLAQELAERLKLRLEITDLPFERLNAGDLGGADIALAQIAMTSERSRVAEFSVPYLPANAGVLVRSGARTRDLFDAREQRWVVEAGTTEVDVVEQIIRPDKEWLVVDTRDETIAALAAGMADAALLDLPTALAIAHSSDGAFEVTGQLLTNQQLAIMLPRGSDNIEAVNAILRNMQASGRLRQLEQEQLVPALGRDPSTVPVIVARAPR